PSQDQQHGHRRVSGIVQPRIPYTRPTQQCLPRVVDRVRNQWPAQLGREDPVVTPTVGAPTRVLDAAYMARSEDGGAVGAAVAHADAEANYEETPTSAFELR